MNKFLQKTKIRHSFTAKMNKAGSVHNGLTKINYYEKIRLIIRCRPPVVIEFL